MSKTRRTYLIAWIAILAVLLAGSILAPDGTGGESVQDAPDQPGAVRVELGTSETPDWSVLYIYEADGICCLEQPYAGIYQGEEALWTFLAAGAAPSTVADTDVWQEVIPCGS